VQPQDGDPCADSWKARRHPMAQTLAAGRFELYLLQDTFPERLVSLLADRNSLAGSPRGAWRVGASRAELLDLGKESAGSRPRYRHLSSR